MNPPLWLPKEPEIEVRYDVGEREKYAENEPSCVYHNVRWKLRPVRPRASPDPGPENFKEIGGRSKHGEFPVVVVREHYRQLGYTVWGSDPRLVNPVTEEDEGYVAVSYSGYRERNHDAYRRMHKIFGAALLRLNEDADRAKMKRNAKMAPKKKTNRAGGDPDLFVFRPDDHLTASSWRSRTRTNLIRIS